MKKLKIICAVILLGIVVVVMLNVKRTISKNNESEVILASNMDNQANFENQGLIIFANDLVPDTKDEETIKQNMEYLQELIDEASSAGGGIVHVPAGTYYFAPSGMNTKKTEYYVIKCKNNVMVEGEGSDENTGTVFKPYGKTKYGLDMFYFNDYKDSNGQEATYLENADFRNFVINSEEAEGEIYNAYGKGFMINLYRNCDWDNVVVKNTDGTGFGMDNPINCTINNCIAIGCGKRATKNDVGASGFGIGTGYSNDESIHISNCTSIGNKKYGIFFEHQGRFFEAYRATKGESFIVSNCIASGNMYDFGGARANDVTYENCTSHENENNKSAIHFELMSRRTHIVNCKVNQEFTDVADSSMYYYNPVYWALNNGITEGITKTQFGPMTTCTKAEAIAFLYKIAERPGDVVYSKGENFETGYTDVSSNDWYADAAKWAKEKEITDPTSTTFSPDVDCNRAEFITFLWKYAGSPVVEIKNNFSDIESGVDYENAVNWAVNKGIIDSVNNSEFLPNNACIRADIVTFLYRFSNSSNNFSITYNLDGGKIEIANPTVYKSGESTFTLNNPTKIGYTFDGWTGSNYTEIGSVGQNNYIPEKAVTITNSDVGNKTYTANWTPNNYTVCFDANGGTGNMEEEYFLYDVPQVLSSNGFTKTGYKFQEWNTKKDGTGTSYNNAVAVTNLTEKANGSIILYAQWVENKEPPKEITLDSTKYIIQDLYITGIEEDTNVETLLNNLETNGTIEIYNHNNEKIQGQATIGTGMKLLLSNEVEYHLIVNGDLNGDGKISITDLSKMKSHIIGKQILQDEYKKAADMNGDEICSITDISKMKKYLVEK